MTLPYRTRITMVVDVSLHDGAIEAARMVRGSLDYPAIVNIDVVDVESNFEEGADSVGLKQVNDYTFERISDILGGRE